MKSITIASQTFTKRVSKVKLPYIDQVAGFYLFGANAASSLTNLAYGASQNLSEISTPTYGAGYAELTSTKGFETGFLLDTPFTQIIVGAHTVANTALALIGRGAANGDNFVDMMRLGNNGVSSTVDGWPDGSLAQSIAGLSLAGNIIMAQTWGGAGTRHILSTMSGTSMTVANSSNPIAVKTTTPTHTMKFGTGYVSGAAVFRINAAVLVASVLNQQQIYDIGIYLRALLATRGITVV